MALQGWEAGELFHKLRTHSSPSDTNWCPVDRKRDCKEYGHAKHELTQAGLLDPESTDYLASHLSAVKNGAW